MRKDVQRLHLELLLLRRLAARSRLFTAGPFRAARHIPHPLRAKVPPPCSLLSYPYLPYKKGEEFSSSVECGGRLYVALSPVRNALF